MIYGRCVVGQRAIIHAGAIIGSDGFGFAKEGERWVKIPQIGRVLIGDDVEIGANTSIDRGALDDTQIGDGVKLDNQIQIAHNVRVGENAAMAGCVGVAGSTIIGRRCTIGGAGMIKAGQYTSIFPLEAHEDWRRNAVQIKRLAKLAERVCDLEKKLEQLEKKP